MLLRSLIELHQTQWMGAADAARELGADLITFVGGELEDPRDFAAQANAIYELASAERLDGLIVWPMGRRCISGASNSRRSAAGSIRSHWSPSRRSSPATLPW
jgi:hypothetical protein